MNTEEKLNSIRKRIFQVAYKGGTGHIASAYSMVEILYVLYFEGILNYKSDNPNWEYRDKLILSKGHGSLALYVMLERAGFFSKNDLDTFAKPGSAFGNEPKLGDIPGIEASTGSLGHGLPFAVGVAMAHKLKRLPGKVYCIIGDGECQEGSIWEAVMAANRFKLDNLTVILDNNKLQAMDTVKKIMGIERWEGKFKEFGWLTKNVNGHSTEDIKEALLSLRDIQNSPSILIADTVKGKGVSFMENVPIWHYRMPSESELEIILKELKMEAYELNL